MHNYISISTECTTLTCEMCSCTDLHMLGNHRMQVWVLLTKQNSAGNSFLLANAVLYNIYPRAQASKVM